MGGKIKDLSGLEVPGPGTYNHKNSLENIKSSKFGTGTRSELGINNRSPGPG
mgnify:CR=1 FL=1